MSRENSYVVYNDGQNAIITATGQENNWISVTNKGGIVWVDGVVVGRNTIKAGETVVYTHTQGGWRGTKKRQKKSIKVAKIPLPNDYIKIRGLKIVSRQNSVTNAHTIVSTTYEKKEAKDK